MAADRSKAHSNKWARVNEDLRRVGCAMTWYDNPKTDDYRYRLNRLFPVFENLGIYDDEQSALSMARLLTSQYNYEGE